MNKFNNKSIYCTTLYYFAEKKKITETKVLMLSFDLEL